jgi:hypothetical protein
MHNAGWRRRAVRASAHDHATKAMAGHPIDIFIDTNGVKTPAFVNMGGDGML